MTQPSFCPRCRQNKPTGLLHLTAPSRGTVFQGCPDCLISELDELARYRVDPCCVCGTKKDLTLFAGGGKRLECPVHIHARGLLGQCLQALRRLAVDSDDPELPTLCMKLVDALGVEEPSP